MARTLGLRGGSSGLAVLHVGKASRGGDFWFLYDGFCVVLYPVVYYSVISYWQGIGKAAGSQSHWKHGFFFQLLGIENVVTSKRA